MDELIIIGFLVGAILFIVLIFGRKKSNEVKKTSINNNEKVDFYSNPGTFEHERHNYENYGKKHEDKWSKYDNEKDKKWKKYDEE